MKTPVAELEGKGTVDVETGEIREIRMAGSKVALEKIIRRFPRLQAALPTDVGFSGESDFDLSLAGTWDYLSLHFSMDLAPAVLTYRKIFSKPKDFPLTVSGDLVLKGGSLLSGDLSIRLAGTMIKTALVGLDFKSGETEVTFLTNKFALDGWQGLLNFLAGHTVAGSAKVLLHWDGNLNDPRTAAQTLNVTLDGASFLSADGRGLRNAVLFLDVGELGLRVKDTSFEIGNSPVRLTGEIYNFNANPQRKGNLTLESFSLEPVAALDHLKVLKPLLPSREAKRRWTETEKKIRQIFPAEVPLEGLKLAAKFQPGKFVVENLSFRALDGDFQFRGEADSASPPPRFWVESDLAHVSLSRYFEKRGRGAKPLEGNLFFKGKFQGQGWKASELEKNLTGEGTLSLTNGDWRALDLLTPLTRLDVLRSLHAYAGRSTSFSDLNAKWTYGKGKFDTEDLLLNSGELWVEGEGDLSWEGAFNGRLEVYLSKPLTEKVLRAWGEEEHMGKQLGPFPFLFLGQFEKPEVRPEARSMASFLEAVRARKFRKILRSPFKE